MTLRLFFIASLVACGACATQAGGVLPEPDAGLASDADAGELPLDGGADAGTQRADGGPLVDGGTTSDGGAAVDGGTSLCSPACETGQRCFLGACIVDTACRVDANCQDDRYCLDGRCVPYGLGPRGERNASCSRVVPAGLLAPRLFCEWLGPGAGDPFPNHKQALSTPLVLDFNFEGRSRLDDPTVKPSIVLNTYDGNDGECGLYPNQSGQRFGVIRVLDGRTCAQQHVVPPDATGPRLNGAATPTLGDLDRDGRAEIVALSASGGVVAFRFDRAATPPRWAVLWQSHDAMGAPHNPLAGRCMWTGPSIADLDDDGSPEVMVEGFVYDATGKLIDASAGFLNGPANHGVGNFAVLADVDGDGAVELVSARRIMRWNLMTRRFDLVRDLPYLTGFVAVADLGAVVSGRLDRTRLDGVAELAIITGGQLVVHALDGTVLFGPLSLPGSRGGGPPTIGDFDNDGRPEIAAAGSDSYTVFDPDCAQGATTDVCPTGRTAGILWSTPSQDHSSNITGSSLFDFEGNGTAEAVYADECFARIHDGKTGEVLFSQEHSSCTWNEYPVVADVTGNFRSKLLVPSNESCNVSCPAVDPTFKGLRCSAPADCPNALACVSGFCRCAADADCNTASFGGGFVCRAAPTGVPAGGQTCQAAFTRKRSGVRVFGDVLDRWASSRPVWNQHVYTVTNVRDDGAIPRTSEAARNWTQPGLNNFRMNVQGAASPQAAADLTARAPALQGVCGDVGVTLQAQVCNRGTAPVGDGLVVTFRENGAELCRVSTASALAPGTCAPVSCMWLGGSAGVHTVEVRADDDGTATGQTTECDEANNGATLLVGCRPR